MTPARRDARLPAAILEQRAAFLAFLERRLGSRAAAEEVLQAAYLKALEKASGIAREESAVAWFYRLLRNALVDRRRHLDAEARALEQHAAEVAADADQVDAPLEAAVCRCIDGIIPTLRSEHAEIVRRVDLGGATVPEAAGALGITPNNAAVRLHRARAALETQLRRTCGACADHGCLDCTCRAPSEPYRAR